jgi:hypothetical protein
MLAGVVLVGSNGLLQGREVTRREGSLCRARGRAEDSLCGERGRVVRAVRWMASFGRWCDRFIKVMDL